MSLKNNNKSTGSFRRKDGAMLPASIIVTLIAGLWIGSFVQLAQTEIRTSHGAFHFNGSLNLAEGAVERGMLALNARNWTGWTEEGGKVTMEESIELGRGTTGILRATIHDRHTDEPRIVAEGIVVLPNQRNVSRRLEVSLEKRRLFENGFTFGGSVKFNGNGITIDSYDSSLGEYDPVTNRKANGTLASLLVEPGSDINLGNAKIFGYVAVRYGDPDVGPNGNISYLDAPNGTVEESRITRDFAAFLAPVVEPTGSGIPLGIINRDWTNPEAESAAWTLGRPGVKTVYEVDAINFNNQTLTIVGHVEIRVIGDIDIGSNGSLIVEAGSQAVIYAGKDVTIGGAVNRTTDPKNLMFYGTSLTTQNFTLHGGSNWVTSIYAPNADIYLRGGASDKGAFFGAMVGRNFTVGGTWDIHYDEVLSSFTAPFSTYRLSLWQEHFVAANDVVALN